MKKKIKKKWIILGVIAIVLIGAGAASAILGGKNAGMPVNVTDVSKMDMKQVIDISGTVQSEEITTYFAGANAQIAELNVKDGEEVKKGVSLVSYDTTELESALAKAQLEKKSADLGSDIVVIGVNDAQRKVGEAASKYDEAVQYVQHYTDCVSQLKGQLAAANELTAQKASLEGEITALNAELKKKPESKVIPNTIEQKTEELKEVKRQLKAYDLSALESALELCSEDLAEYKAQEAEYKAGKEAADPAAQKQKEQQSVAKEISAFSEKEIEDEIAKAKEGVSSKAQGIVSDVKVVKGQMVQAGEPLFNIADSTKVKVTVQLTKQNLENIAVGQKADLTINGKEYTGEVSKINRVASTNQAGATVVDADIHIDRPDDNIYLGVEAKVNIEVASKEGVLAVPLACVNYGTDNTFCYVVKDGVIAKKEVELGIISDEYIEIVSGLEQTDQIVNSMGAEYEEGTAVTPVKEEEK